MKVMTTPVELSFVLLYVFVLDESLDYYTKTIGLHHVPEADTPVFRGFGPEPGHLSFGICKPFDETRQAGQAEVYFNTNELDRMHATLADKGVNTTPITKQYFGHIFTVDSPDEHLVTMVGSSSAQ